MTDSATNGSRNAAGQFVKGNRIGGRPKGSRNKLSEAFLADLHATWRKHGKKALERVAESAPETFLRVCATVLPKAMEIDGVLNVEHHSTHYIEARDFADAYEKWGRHIGAEMPRMLEARVVENDEEPDEH